MAVTLDGVSSFTRQFQDSQELQDLPPRTDGRVIVFKMPTFTVFDGTFMALSMVTYIADIGTDLNLVVRYFLSNSLVWASLTLTLVLFPAIVVMMLSMRWHIADGHPVTKLYWTAHVFLWGIFHRYVLMLKTGLKARQSEELTDYDELYRQQSDVCMLRMFESFMESAPQLVLQLYIMMSYHDYSAWTAITAFTSMVSLAWGIAAYTKAMRNARLDKHKMTISGLTLQTLWRVGMIAARVASLALVGTVLEGWLLLIIALHMLVMFIWVISQKTGFSSTKWEEIVFNFIMAVTYCFCFFNLKEGHSKWRMLAFYSIIVTENTTFVLLYYFLGRHEAWLKYTALGVVFGGMVVGLLCLVFYYRYFHPVGPLDPFKTWTKHKGIADKDVEKASNQGRSISDGGEDNTKCPSRSSMRRNIKFLYPPVTKLSTCILSAPGVSLKSSPASAKIETDSNLNLQANSSSPRLSYIKPSEVMCSVQDLLANMSCGDASETNEENDIDNDITGDGSPGTSPAGMERHGPSSFERSMTKELDIRLSSSDFKSSHNVEDVSATSDVNEVESPRSATSQDNPKSTSYTLTLATHSSPNSVGIPTKANVTNCISLNRDSSGSSILRTSVMKNGHVSSSTDMRLTSLPHLTNSRVSVCSQSAREGELDPLETTETVKPPNVELAVIDRMHIIEIESSGVSSENLSDYENVCEGDEKPARHLPPKPANLLAQNLDETQTTQSSVPHDYENICAININREMWGVRHWRTYSDIEDRIHDDSTFKERLKLLDSTMTSSHSSDYSILKAIRSRRSISLTDDCDSVLTRSLPDLSSLRLETCYEDAEEEEREDEKINDMNKTEDVKDDERLMAMLNQLRENRPFNRSSSVDDIPNYETIWVGDVEKPEATDSSSWMNSLSSKSSLVVTIGDVRAKESLCNLYYSTMSDLSFRYYSERMRQNGSMLSRASKKSRADTSKEMVRAISVPDNKTLMEVSEIIEEERKRELEEEDHSKHPEAPTKDQIGCNNNCETPLKSGANSRPRRKFSILRERFEQPWTPLRSPLRQRQPAQRRNSLQERTAKALQAGMKVFRRPRVHVITPKKGGEDKDTPRLKSPFRSKNTTPTPPAIRLPNDAPIDSKTSGKSSTKTSSKIDLDCGRTPALKTPLTRELTDHRLTKSTPKTSTPDNTKPASCKKVPGNALDAKKANRLQEGPKTSTPEGNKQLQQMSILSTVSSVVPSPEALQRMNLSNLSRRPLSENLRHDISISKSSSTLQLSREPDSKICNNDSVFRKPNGGSRLVAKSTINLRVASTANDIENLQDGSNAPSNFGIHASQSLVSLQAIKVTQQGPGSFMGIPSPSRRLPEITRSALNIVDSLRSPSSRQNVSISRIVLSSPQSPNFSLQKSTLSPNSKIFSRRI